MSTNGGGERAGDHTVDRHLSPTEEDGDGEEEEEQEKVLNLAKEEPGVERTATGEEAGIQAAMQLSLNQVIFLYF